MASDNHPRDEQSDEVYQNVPLSDERHGLGIQLGHPHGHEELNAHHQELPAGAPSPKKACEQHPLISPASSGGFSSSTAYELSPINSPVKAASKRSVNSTWSSIRPASDSDSQINLIEKPSATSNLARYQSLSSVESDDSFHGIKRGRLTCLAVTTLLLTLYAALASGAFMALAITNCPYGHLIRSSGPLTPGLTAFLVSAIAKTIEMAFVTIIIAWLGQELSRRAAYGSGRRRSGFTLAELSMRGWVVQPGTMFSRWDSLRYAGLTGLGVLSIMAAILAMLYTSAATALVQPQLKFLPWKPQTMQGLVRSKFANIDYVHERCNIPASTDGNQLLSNSSCANIEHAAMGYHNYYTYLGQWSNYSLHANASTDLARRPPGVALYNDNTTITAPWILRDSPATLYKDTGIIVNNVSLAFPHVGVAAAAQDAINGIIQPSDLNGIGLYNVRASVPSPIIHVLCATVAEELLYPILDRDWLLVYEATAGVELQNYSDPYRYVDGTSEASVLHEIFGWGEQYGTHNWPPVFSRIPGVYNTLLNGTGDFYWGRYAAYILGTVNSTDASAEGADPANHFVCQLQVSLEPACSTRYNATGSGATLDALCDDPGDEMAYSRSNTSALSGSAVLDSEWPNVAFDWGQSLAFDTGPNDNNASNAQLITQLVLRQPMLDPRLPSAAEALAVMAGCTILSSSEDAPFVQQWDYGNHTILPDPVYQSFNASIRAQQYASGGSKGFQKLGLVILGGVFILSLYAFAYFLRHRDWYTDFSDPSNLFSLAMSSPPSDALAASCATGPKGKDYGVAWRLGEDDGKVYVKSSVPEKTDGGDARKRKGSREESGMHASPRG